VKHHEQATDFDHVVAELQNEIVERERELFSAKVIEQAYNPTNFGRMDEPDAYGTVHGSCGDTMEFYLRLTGEKIERATFTTDGCGSSLACGNILTTMVQGMSLEEAGGVEPEDVIQALDGLPEESEHCATLAVLTLREAIANRGGSSDG
jgi:nitrogen fixation NifU-like protein